MNEERFIKLTQIDGRSIWVNARYLVTVEQRKGSGALVVPLGDGMDYEVRESPEAVIAQCCGASGETASRRPIVQQLEPAAPAVDRQDGVSQLVPVDSEAVPVVSEAGAGQSVEGEKIVEKPAARKTSRKPRATKATTTRTRKTSKAAEKVESVAAEPAVEAATETPPVPPPPAPVPVKSSTLPDRSSEIFKKVAKMACRSRNRLLNTLKSQFALSEEKSHEMMSSWVEAGHITIDGNGHVEWKM